MEVLTRVEVQLFEVGVSTCPDDGSSKTLSKARLVVDALSLESEIYDDKLGGANSRDNHRDAPLPKPLMMPFTTNAV